jgi:hypothetical protein
VGGNKRKVKNYLPKIVFLYSVKTSLSLGEERLYFLWANAYFFVKKIKF